MMNKATKDIAKFCECSVEHAWNIQQRMMANGFDFSECTEREFRRAIIEADSQLIREGFNPLQDANA